LFGYFSMQNLEVADPDEKLRGLSLRSCKISIKLRKVGHWGWSVCDLKETRSTFSGIPHHGKGILSNAEGVGNLELEAPKEGLSGDSGRSDLRSYFMELRGIRHPICYLRLRRTESPI